MPKHQLSKRVYENIATLCKDGDALLESNSDEEALRKYYEAWELIPEDKGNWEASTWVLSAMGEVYFKNKRNEKALHAFSMAIRCPGGLGNPYIHLRLGQIQFESGDQVSAANELTRAYMGGGEEIFQDEDIKYYQFLQSKIAT